MEFQHSKFKKGNFNELSNVKRKINENNEILERYKGDQRSMLDEYTKLKTNYQQIEESLAVVTSQNKRLVNTNKELVCKLYFFKKEYENRIKKVLFCFYVNNNYHNEEVAIKVKEVLEQANLMPIQPIDTNNCLLLCNQIQILVKQLTKKLIFTPDKKVKVLDQLVEIYIKFVNDNVVHEKTSVNWKTILADMFGNEPMDSVIAMPVPEPFTANINKIIRSRENSLHSPYKINSNLSFLNQSLLNDNGSNVESRSASMNEEDLLGEITRKLANGPQSMNDSFIASDAHSLHLFSPRSERSGILKF